MAHFFKKRLDSNRGFPMSEATTRTLPPLLLFCTCLLPLDAIIGMRIFNAVNHCQRINNHQKLMPTDTARIFVGY